MNIQFKNINRDDLSEIKEIYMENHWLSYLNDDKLLHLAFENSLETIGAFDNDKLIGFIRLVGDGAHVVLIQDLIFKKDYQHQGIGTSLIQMVFEKYAHIRMILVVTDLEDEIDNQFYQKQKMRHLEDCHMTAYIR